MNNKVCVVGAGSWGANHINSLLQLDALGGIVESKKELLASFIKFKIEFRSSSNDFSLFIMANYNQ